MRAVDPRIRAVFLADGCGSGKSQKATARAACAHSQSAARLARREHARRGKRRAGLRVEERVWPGEPAPPPAKNRRCAAGGELERSRRRRVARQRPAGRASIDAAEGRPKHVVKGTRARVGAHEGMNEADDRDARADGVADRSAATIGVPAQESFGGQAQAAHGLSASGELRPLRGGLSVVKPTRNEEPMIEAWASATRLWPPYACSALGMKSRKSPAVSRGAFTFRISCRGNSVLGRPGSDLLFQALRLSTIGAEDFDGRVRDGIG